MSWYEIAAVASAVGLVARVVVGLVRHWLNLRFMRHALDKHGPAALNAAARALHRLAAIQARGRQPTTTDPDPATPPTTKPPGHER